jgi:hypothetical protein
MDQFDSSPQILHISLDQTSVKYLIGTESGYSIYDIHTLQPYQENHSVAGGIKTIEHISCIEDDSYLALVGGGEFPHFPSNVLNIFKFTETKTDEP